VDLAHLVGNPCIEENPFRDRGLAGIDMRHDPDIAAFLQLNRSSHGVFFAQPPCGWRALARENLEPCL